MRVTEIGRKTMKKLPAETYTAELKKMRQEHEKMVKGMFEFVDAPGGFFEFDYRFFPGQPITKIYLTHGEITEIPLGVVKHLNGCMKKVRTINPEQSQKGLLSTFQKFSRLKFTPVDWT
jgi:hypothetical protein